MSVSDRVQQAREGVARINANHPADHPVAHMIDYPGQRLIDEQAKREQERHCPGCTWCKPPSKGTR